MSGREKYKYTEQLQRHSIDLHKNLVFIYNTFQLQAFQLVAPTITYGKYNVKGRFKARQMESFKKLYIDVNEY